MTYLSLDSGKPSFNEKTATRVRRRSLAGSYRLQDKITLLEARLAAVLRARDRKREEARRFGAPISSGIRDVVHLHRVQTFLDIVSPHLDSAIPVPAGELLLDLREDEDSGLAWEFAGLIVGPNHLAARCLGIEYPAYDLQEAIDDARFHEMTFEEMVRVWDSALICLRGHYGDRLNITALDPAKARGARIERKWYLQLASSDRLTWREAANTYASGAGLIQLRHDENAIPRWVRPPGISAWLKRSFGGRK
jgi:hypothetical protein